MENRLKIAAILNMAFYGLLILLNVYVYLTDLNADVPRVTLATVGYQIFLTLPYLIAGFGLLKRWHWARNVMFPLSAIGLLRFPVGTVIGLYTIWVLWNKETQTLFSPGT